MRSYLRGKGVKQVKKNYSSVSKMTELSLDDLTKAVSEKNSHLKDENVLLSQQMLSQKEAMITQESLKDSDVKVKYYTGLPS